MHEAITLREKLKLFFIILIPILITQVSMYLMNFFDTIMSGHAGAEDIAGVAIASSLWVPIFTGVNGIILAITPIVAQLIGAHEHKHVSHKIQQGLYLAIAIACSMLFVILFILLPILNTIDIDPSVRHIAKYYLLSISTGIVPLFIFNTMRSFIDALGKTRISMIIILISLPLNIFFNYVFIFGKLGVPALGGIGSGIATAITYWTVCFISVGIVYKVRPFRTYQVFSQWEKPLLSEWWEQLKIGIPIGFAIFFETSIFAAVTLLMSVYSTYTIAAHQAAMNFASMLYMVPLSVGIALTIAVGYEVGANRFQDARTYTYIGLSSGIFIAIFAGVILYVFDDFVAGLYHTNPQVIALTKQFIFYAVFYQLADAFGAPIQGALRGYKDVNMTSVIALLSYWKVGLPTG